jgi:hypothetical protein
MLPAEALQFAADGMSRTHVQVSHPRYFGLFNPAPTAMGIAADALVAASRAGKTDDLKKILGPSGRRLIFSGDRVADQAGRIATVSVFADDSTAMASTGTESGVEVDRDAGSTSRSDTAEIPSMIAPAPGDPGSGGLAEPAPRADEGLGSGGFVGGGIGAPMGNIQVNIEAVNPVNPLSHLYQVVGQIIGHGVRRAGIYIDGRLVKRLPVSRGNLTNFATTFRQSGGTATIRAFGAGNQYVESSIAMPAAAPPMPPIMVAPYGMNPYVMDPYGSFYGSPYGVPYGTPYGATPSYGYNVSPYGITRYPISPYGAGPSGAAPYGVNPYAPPINPYGSVPPMGPAGR